MMTGLIAISPFAGHASAAPSGPWQTTKVTYPLSITNQSCVTYSGYIYCVGGGTNSNVTNADYFGAASPSGVGQWNSTTSYPKSIYGQSCATWSGYIYCVGGDAKAGITNIDYFATVSSFGIGAWTSTTPYNTEIYGQSCATSSGYIYCVGGYTGSSYSNNVYFAPVSSSGIGAWTNSTTYPMTVGLEPCVISSGYIYCVGGANTLGNQNNAVYYAAVSSSGVGAWALTTSYPTGIALESCVIDSGYLYCVGGSLSSSKYSDGVYFAAVSPSGVGAWTAAASYPTSIYNQSCATSSGYIYCIGGYADSDTYSNAVYYAGLTSLQTSVPVTSTSTIASPTNATSTSSSTSSKTSGTTPVVTSATSSTTSLPAPEFPYFLVVPVLFTALALMVLIQRLTKPIARTPSDPPSH